MAKINYVEINNTIRYIENVAFLQALPVANADSEDFVSVNNVLYVKQINNGVYSYAEIGGSAGTEIKSITFSAPSTATQGTITSSDLATLQENDNNYIIFNDEIFRLNDKQHESGYLVYSHNGHDTTGCFFQKCITITISTLGWVLESQENQPKLTAGTNITIENNVISASSGSGGGSSEKTTITGVSISSEFPNFLSSSTTGITSIVDIYSLPTEINDFTNTNIQIETSGLTIEMSYNKTFNMYSVDMSSLQSGVVFYGVYIKSNEYILLVMFSGSNYIKPTIGCQYFSVGTYTPYTKTLTQLEYNVFSILLTKEVLSALVIVSGNFRYCFVSKLAIEISPNDFNVSTITAKFYDYVASRIITLTMLSSTLTFQFSVESIT